MKKIILLLLLLPFTSFAQEKDYSSNSISFSIGRVHEDGLLAFRHPSIGIGYEKKLNKWFSLQIRLVSLFRSGGDVKFLDRLDNPAVGQIRPGSTSPFITQDDIDSFSDQGLKDIGELNFYKSISLPLNVGIKFTPLRFKQFAFNMYAGPSLVFQNSNSDLEFFSGLADVSLSNGDEISTELTLYSETHFRNFYLSESLGAGIEYQIKLFSIECYFGENSTLINRGINTWDLSLKLKFTL